VGVIAVFGVVFLRTPYGRPSSVDSAGFLTWLDCYGKCPVLILVLALIMLAASARVGSDLEFGLSSIASLVAGRLKDTIEPRSDGPRLITRSSG
jgi:hypothetical protein